MQDLGKEINNQLGHIHPPLLNEAWTCTAQRNVCTSVSCLLLTAFPRICLPALLHSWGRASVSIVSSGRKIKNTRIPFLRAFDAILPPGLGWLNSNRSSVHLIDGCAGSLAKFPIYCKSARKLKCESMTGLKHPRMFDRLHPLGCICLCLF